jgi:hypothetical protein
VKRDELAPSIAGIGCGLALVITVKLISVAVVVFIAAHVWRAVVTP